MEFKKGDKVKFGNKAGVVVAVVADRSCPLCTLRIGGDTGDDKGTYERGPGVMHGGYIPRKNESYLVLVGKTLYWPLVEYLSVDSDIKVGDVVTFNKFRTGTVAAVLSPGGCPGCAANGAGVNGKGPDAVPHSGYVYVVSYIVVDIHSKRPYHTSNVVRKERPADTKPVAATPPSASTDGKFKVGDRVTWRSQAGGVAKTKVGTVAYVVPPRRRLRDEVLMLRELPKGYYGSTRGHESYLVRIGKRTRLNWPVVSRLSLVQEGVIPANANVPTAPGSKDAVRAEAIAAIQKADSAFVVTLTGDQRHTLVFGGNNKLPENIVIALANWLTSK